MPRRIFVDTGFLLALYNTRDENHQDAQRWYRESTEKGWKYVTSYYCVLEVYDWCSSPGDRSICASIHEDLVGSSKATIIPVSQESVEAGIEYYELRQDQGWELTDCVNFRLMDAQDLRRALTFDTDFQAAGFRALPLEP